MTGTMSARPTARGNIPRKMASQGLAVTVMTARESRHSQNPSRKDLRRPMESTSDPTRTVTRVMMVDHQAMVSPAAVSEKPRSEDSHRTRVEDINP